MTDYSRDFRLRQREAERFPSQLFRLALAALVVATVLAAIAGAVT